MRRIAFGVAVASLTLATGCSGNGGSTATAPSPTGQTGQTTSPAASTAPVSTAPASTAPASTASVGSASGTPNVLTGTVGSKDNPDAFVISLADSSGKPVTTLPAGRYQVRVNDLSKIHNFHLKGAAVDDTTTVPEVTETTFDVALQPGQYTFICDPHPRMVGTFTVT